MDITSIIEYGMTAIGGGAVFKALDYFINVKRENRSDFDLINQRLNDEIKRLYERLNLLEKENEVLEDRVKVLEGTVEDLPFPMWHKDLNGNYSWVNQSFINTFLSPLGKSARDILGNQGRAVWSQTFIDTLSDLDRMAMASGTKTAFKRNVIIDPYIPPHTLHKFPLYLKKILIGYGGIALNEN